MAQLLDGKGLSSKIREEIRGAVEEINARKEIIPGLAVIMVGNNPASALYVGGKKKACGEVGFHSVQMNLPETVSQKELIEHVQHFNQDPSIHGILVQLPLPSHLQAQLIIDTIAPEKDVDGFHPINMGNLVIGDECLIPCTPLGIIELLKRYQIPVSGKKALMIGRSNIVGKPMAMLLLRENATVTIAHSKTPDLEKEVGTADLVIASVGKPHVIKGEWIKPGAVVIDVGINVIPDSASPKGTKTVGDVVFETAVLRASAITPVPGGIGPMTNAMLLWNTLKARNAIIGKNTTMRRNCDGK